MPGRSARTVWTIQDLEHCAKEFGYILCAEGGMREGRKLHGHIGTVDSYYSRYLRSVKSLQTRH